LILLAVSAALGASAPAATADTTPTATADLGTTVTPFNVGPYAVVGATIGYRITVTNDGPDAASDVVLTDTANPSLGSQYLTKFTCVGGPSGAWCGPLASTVSCSPLPAGYIKVIGTARLFYPGTVTCTNESLSAGASMTINVGVRVGSYFHNQLICDTASVTSSTVGSDSGNTACVRVM
jgi:hypothetical protein